MNNAWEQVLGSNNMVLEGDGFYISYNPDCSANVLSRVVDLIMGEHQTEETAIVTNDGNYYILNGDHRTEYEQRISSFNACLKYYKSRPNEWAYSSDEIESVS